ncbi:MAG: hypothetical protein IJ809_04925 [Clostridia bacterium]|nr:hypothetical protein [Clostridia bacterium]
MAVKKQTFLKGVFVIMMAQIFIKLLGFVYRVVLTNFKEFADVGNSYYRLWFFSVCFPACNSNTWNTKYNVKAGI